MVQFLPHPVETRAAVTIYHISKNWTEKSSIYLLSSVSTMLIICAIPIAYTQCPEKKCQIIFDCNSAKC